VGAPSGPGRTGTPLAHGAADGSRTRRAVPLGDVLRRVPWRLPGGHRRRAVAGRREGRSGQPETAAGRCPTRRGARIAGAPALPARAAVHRRAAQGGGPDLQRPAVRLPGNPPPAAEERRVQRATGVPRGTHRRSRAPGRLASGAPGAGGIPRGTCRGLRSLPGHQRHHLPVPLRLVPAISGSARPGPILDAGWVVAGCSCRFRGGPADRIRPQSPDQGCARGGLPSRCNRCRTCRRPIGH
jgi:hypothetical protein